MVLKQQFPSLRKIFGADTSDPWLPASSQLGCLVFPNLNSSWSNSAGCICFNHSRGTPEFGLASEQRPELDFLSDNSTAVRGSEACTRAEGVEQVRAAGDLGDRPLIVLASRGEATGGTPAQQGSIAAAWNEAEIEQVQPMAGQAVIPRPPRASWTTTSPLGAIVGADPRGRRGHGRATVNELSI